MGCYDNSGYGNHMSAQCSGKCANRHYRQDVKACNIQQSRSGLNKCWHEKQLILASTSPNLEDVHHGKGLAGCKLGMVHSFRVPMDDFLLPQSNGNHDVASMHRQEGQKHLAASSVSCASELKHALWCAMCTHDSD
jgi:hypothetical protein